MIDFQWELKQVVSGIRKGLLEKQVTFFLRPHDAIWGPNSTDFTQLADEIMALLPDKQMQRQFLSVCLGSYLLNPSRAQKAVPAWIHGKIPVADLLGIDVTLDEVLSWRWDRVGFPVLDEYEHGKNDTIYYALLAKTTSEANPLHPTWASDVMNADALDAVTIAAELAEKAHPGRRFFFWPFINPRKPTHDRSLGLPVYLSFLSLVKSKRIPMFIATGEVDRQGRLHPVQGVQNKSDKAFEKKYKKFIYSAFPEDIASLERRREQVPVGVTDLVEAEREWGIHEAGRRFLYGGIMGNNTSNYLKKGEPATQAYLDNMQFHILSALSVATKSIHIAVAWFTDLQIFSLLRTKSNEGVEIHLIIANDAKNAGSGIDFDELRQSGATVEEIPLRKKKQNNLTMHNRFCVIDAEMVIISSYNWTFDEQSHNEHITVVTGAPELASQFIEEFSQILNRFKDKDGDTAFDHGKLIARLEALRGVIYAEDEDDIAQQLFKLKKMLPARDEYADVREIISSVENGDLEEAEALIITWLNSNKQVAVWVDPDIFELKLELKSLEIQINALEDEKAELEKQLYAFQYRYAIELGELIQNILYRRMQTLKLEAKLDSEKQAEYEEAQKDYDDFTQDCEENSSREFWELSPDLQQELKARYRACSKLCHPDIVAPEQREAAKEVFSQLNDANERNDLEAVNRIYENLNQGLFITTSDSTSDSKKLHSAVMCMREKVAEIDVVIRTIRKSDAYRKIAAIENWDNYFAELRAELEDELKRHVADE